MIVAKCIYHPQYNANDCYMCEHDRRVSTHSTFTPTPSGCTFKCKGEIEKGAFLILLDYLDDMKQRGWEFVKHERTDLSNGNIRIDYELKSN